ncbi:unnamed protein product [Vitrella brassicaformis CCMP3155]|uniref:Uncharacterized protein n=1 Tax=Vitrella brassicaformis (strain CCMP3155) TaxID=1169540 RepID=A0A0G4EE03_VITBC|nr:unnamed protein product [Vitrella brassicaformis CCMP3155]|eukprot:CEL93558.1 unnamed protein product [Vitrella brassicaformis CCMP3155]
MEQLRGLDVLPDDLLVWIARFLSSYPSQVLRVLGRGSRRLCAWCHSYYASVTFWQRQGDAANQALLDDAKVRADALSRQPPNRGVKVIFFSLPFDDKAQLLPLARIVELCTASLQELIVDCPSDQESIYQDLPCGLVRPRTGHRRRPPTVKINLPHLRRAVLSHVWFCMAEIRQWNAPRLERLEHGLPGERIWCVADDEALFRGAMWWVSHAARLRAVALGKRGERRWLDVIRSIPQNRFAIDTITDMELGESTVGIFDDRSLRERLDRSVSTISVDVPLHTLTASAQRSLVWVTTLFRRSIIRPGASERYYTASFHANIFVDCPNDFLYSNAMVLELLADSCKTVIIPVWGGPWCQPPLLVFKTATTIRFSVENDTPFKRWTPLPRTLLSPAVYPSVTTIEGLPEHQMTTEARHFLTEMKTIRRVIVTQSPSLFSGPAFILPACAAYSARGNCAGGLIDVHTKVRIDRPELGAVQWSLWERCSEAVDLAAVEKRIRSIRVTVTVLQQGMEGDASAVLREARALPACTSVEMKVKIATAPGHEAEEALAIPPRDSFFPNVGPPLAEGEEIPDGHVGDAGMLAIMDGEE